MTFGSVPYSYATDELEVTVSQYVAFVSTVDPRGRNQRRLFSKDESSAA